MNLLRTFGWGEKKLLNSGHTAVGRVIEVKKCWWLKVNTKPVRMGPTDGAIFPHIIHFTYQVDGATYHGSRYVGLSPIFPHKGESLTVFYDPNAPRRCAVLV